MNTDRLLTLATVPVFVGTVAGLYHASAEVLANGWLAAGFWRNTGVVLSADVTWGVILGFGLVFLAAVPARMLAAHPEGWLAGLVADSRRAGTLLAGLLLWTVWAEALHLPRLPLTLPVFAAFGWLTLAALERLRRLRPLVAEGGAAAGLAAASFLLLVHGPWAHEALTLGPDATGLIYDAAARDLSPSGLRGLLLASLALVCAQAAWVMTARDERTGRLLRWGGVTAVAGASLSGRVLTLFGAGLTPTSPTPVVVVAIDTLRADHVRVGLRDETPYPTTPHLGRLAESSTVYASAYSASSWTLPSFASIATGRYPHEHGAISFAAWLRRGEATLAEVLREAGYATSAVVSHIFVDAEHGFGQGFDHFDDALADASEGMHQRLTGGEVTDRALAWLDGRPTSQPFFLWVHYFDPHYDYLDHEDRDWASGSLGALEGLGLEDLRIQVRHLEDDHVDELRARYDEEIAYTDAQIGRLLDHPALADALIVVVADHGEAFMERDWLGHTVSLHAEVTRVPLLVRRPGGTRVDVPSVVEARGVYGTVLDAVGLPTEAPVLPRTPTPGTALSTVWLDGPPAKRSHLAAWRTDDTTLILDAERGEEWAYDRRVDPAELEDGAPVPEASRAALVPILEALGTTSAGSRDMSAAEIEQLKALGYL